MTAVMEPRATTPSPAVHPVTDHYASALRHKRFANRVTYCNDIRALGCGPIAAAMALAERKCDVIVLGPAVDVLDALGVAEHIDKEHPEMVLVLLAAPSPELFELAMEAGVRRIVRPDAPFPELLAVVDDALDRVERRRDNTVIDLREPAPTTPPVRTGRVITVLSPKGGAGKTTIATNLASGLARVMPDRVAIVDLDLQFGDVADALFLSPTHTLLDVPATGVPDSATVKLALTPTGNGLYALCAPDDPAAGEEVSIEAAGRAIDALAADLPFVVVDTGAGIDAAALAAIERSTDLVFVGSLDVPSIRSVRKLLHALDRLEMTGATRHVVLNRADSDVGVTADEVAETLGMPISVQVPSSRAVPASINAGTPIVIAEPTSNVARPLQQLVGLFVDVPETAAKPRRLGIRRPR